jgi:pimeloyl-ACP methyl ester carboxylesterase
MSRENVTVVLVHGAWADGASWAKVIGPLTADGVRVPAAPLPLTSYAEDTAAVERTLERAPGPVVLEGHAYAGAMIASTRNENVKALVYIAALAPDQGETVADVFYHSQPHPMAPKLAPDKHGLIYLPHEAFAAAFAQNASSDELALLSAVRRPLSPACINVPVNRPLWKDRPTWFLIAEQDRMIVQETQRSMAERMHAREWSHPVDHAPIINAPGLVVDIIREAIGEAISADRLRFCIVTRRTSRKQKTTTARPGAFADCPRVAILTGRRWANA